MFLGRRGRWWNRLSIDLDHLARPVDVCVACLNGVDDPYVAVGDRRTIQDRLSRYQRNYGAAATAKRRSTGFSAPTYLASATAPTTPAEITDVADFLKAVAMSAVSDRVCRGFEVPPKFMSPTRGWIGGVRGEVTITGNPLNRTAGEKSIFVGVNSADLSVGVDASITRLRYGDGSACAAPASCDALANITSDVMAAVDAATQLSAPVLRKLSFKWKVADAAVVAGDVHAPDINTDVPQEPAGDPVMSVEAYALQHYAQAGGWTGSHCEGAVFHSLFGLLLWEVCCFVNHHL